MWTSPLLAYLVMGMEGSTASRSVAESDARQFGPMLSWSSPDGYDPRGGPMPDLPIGTVTFLFTDIEGSTRLLQRLGDEFRTVVDHHGRILREAIQAGGGTEVGTEGDSFFATFPTPRGAVMAAVQAQRALAAEAWPEGTSVRV